MKLSAPDTLAATLFATATATASADPISFCAQGNSDVCFQVAIPESSAGSGSGDIYFQLTAPDSFSWVALGIGTLMTKSNIFLVYEDGDGNVTISGRQASSYSMPQEIRAQDGGADLELLSGSGVHSDGVMVANVRCANCESLGGDEPMVLGSNDTAWVGAWKTAGNAAEPSENDGNIEPHDEEPERFSLDLTRAAVDGDGHPFTGANSRPRPEGSDNDAVGGLEDDRVSGNVLLAHGIVMTIVFVAWYPLGAILMIVVGKWFVHAGWQFVAFLAMWAGFALGYLYARDYNYLFNNSHTVLGLVVVILMGLQPFLGYAHHAHRKKHQSRGLVSYSHIWLGRLAMFLGILNGGFGLRMAGSPAAWVTSYAVVAAVIGGGYVVVMAFMAWRRRKRQAEAGAGARSPEQGSDDSRKPGRGA